MSSHWTCRNCGVHNSNQRTECIGCGKTITNNILPQKKRIRIIRKTNEEIISSNMFAKIKSECMSCCGSMLCNKHKKIAKKIEWQKTVYSVKQ